MEFECVASALWSPLRLMPPSGDSCGPKSVAHRRLTSLGRPAILPERLRDIRDDAIAVVIQHPETILGLDVDPQCRQRLGKFLSTLHVVTPPPGLDPNARTVHGLGRRAKHGPHSSRRCAPPLNPARPSKHSARPRLQCRRRLSRLRRGPGGGRQQQERRGKPPERDGAPGADTHREEECAPRSAVTRKLKARRAIQSRGANAPYQPTGVCCGGPGTRTPRWPCRRLRGAGGGARLRGEPRQCVGGRVSTNHPGGGSAVWNGVSKDRRRNAEQPRP